MPYLKPSTDDAVTSKGVWDLHYTGKPSDVVGWLNQCPDLHHMFEVYVSRSQTFFPVDVYLAEAEYQAAEEKKLRGWGARGYIKRHDGIAGNAEK